MTTILRQLIGLSLLGLLCSSGGRAQSFEVNEGLSGAWYDPQTDGQGVVFDIVGSSGFVFMAWFTFDTGASSKLGAPDQRWLTAHGELEGTLAEMSLNVTTGGVFDDPTPSVTTPVGTATIEFLSCTEARLSYSLTDEGLSGDIALQRVSPADVCRTLTAADEGSQPTLRSRRQH